MDKLFFDIESTGLDTNSDRIVQLAIKVIDDEGNTLINKSKLYNPGISISDSAFKTHGISDSDVKDCPSFATDAKKLKTLFENKIIIGYNIMRFDVPMLMNEFDRAGIDVNFSGVFIDVLNIEKKLNSNKLSEVYEKYTGEKLEGAHDALADINATDIVLQHQTQKLARDLIARPTVEILQEWSGTKDIVDFYGKFTRDDQGYLIINFGQKCKGKRLVDEPGYADWMLKEAFPSQVKKLINTEMQKKTRETFKKLPQSSPISFGQKDFKPIDDELPF